MTRKYLQESVKLAPKKADGSYPIVIITEGEGSSGVYRDHLFTEGASEHVFEGVPSFMDHPIDPAKPHLRSVNSIGGRVSGVHIGEDDGKAALLGEYKPRKEYAEFVEEFADTLGISIFCGAEGEVMEDGRLDVDAFDGEDPYRSVDIVVAAGRGGRFKRAEESLRVLESSLGIPQGNKPGATAAPGEKERNMEIKDVFDAVKALESTFAPVVAFVAEQKAAADAAVAEAETKVTAATEEKDAAIEAYSAAVTAVSEAELLPSQETEILAAAKAGKDIAPLLESAKKVVDEAKQAVAGELDGYTLTESAIGGSAKSKDWSY